jgi:hypothetical protein
MFEFGLFSTHIPYIITVVAYLLSYGFYAFNKPNAEIAEPNIAASISSSHEIRIEKGATHQTYDASCHFQASQAVRQPEQEGLAQLASAAPAKVCCPPNIQATSFYRVYALFSRPPTFC